LSIHSEQGYNFGKIFTAAVIEEFCNVPIVNPGFRIKCGMTERGWIPAEVYLSESEGGNVIRNLW
jgi:hypothetical protein